MTAALLKPSTVGGAGKATMRMAELAAAALRTLAFDDERNQEAARASGALPLLTAQLNPVASAQHRGDERKARRENAATAAARAIHALARFNRANQVGLLCNVACFAVAGGNRWIGLCFMVRKGREFCLLPEGNPRQKKSLATVTPNDGRKSVLLCNLARHLFA